MIYALALLGIVIVIGGGGPLNGAINLITADRLWLGLLLGPISPMLVFGVLYKLYDSFAWRQMWLPLVRAGIPNLSGRWTGQVVFEDDPNIPPLDCEVIITQTWTRIAVAFSGSRESRQQTTSSVIMAALNTMDAINGGLRYEYEVAPVGGASNQPRAVGTAYLRYPNADTTNRLEGGYYNQAQLVSGTWVSHHGAYTLTKA